MKGCKIQAYAGGNHGFFNKQEGVLWEEHFLLTALNTAKFHSFLWTIDAPPDQWKVPERDVTQIWDEWDEHHPVKIKSIVSLSWSPRDLFHATHSLHQLMQSFAAFISKDYVSKLMKNFLSEMLNSVYQSYLASFTGDDSVVDTWGLVPTHLTGDDLNLGWKTKLLITKGDLIKS